MKLLSAWAGRVLRCVYDSVDNYLRLEIPTCLAGLARALLIRFLQIFPTYRRSRPVGPGIEAREIPTGRRRGNAVNLEDAMSLE